MKKFLIYLIVTLIFVAIIGTISFSIISSSKESENINDKVSSEIKYLDTEILEIMNGLNNMRIGLNVNVEKQEEKVSEKNEESSEQSNEESSSPEDSNQSSSSKPEEDQKKNSNTNEIQYLIKNTPIVLVDREDINWENLLKTAERLYSSWATIVIDLNSIDIKNDIILDFSTNLDNLILNLKNNDKEKSLQYASNMYNMLPEYINKTEGISENYYMLKIKSGILKAYSVVEYDKWNVVSEGISEAEEAITSMINSEIMLNNKRQAKIEKIYVLLKELAKTVNAKEKDMFMLKYITLMEKIDAYSD